MNGETEIVIIVGYFHPLFSKKKLERIQKTQKHNSPSQSKIYEIFLLANHQICIFFKCTREYSRLNNMLNALPQQKKPEKQQYHQSSVQYQCLQFTSPFTVYYKVINSKYQKKISRLVQVSVNVGNISCCIKMESLESLQMPLD